MSRITVSGEIARPPVEVFALFTDLRNAVGRVRGISKLEVLTSGPVGAGTRFRETRTMFGRDHTEEMEIAEFDPPEGYVVTCHSGGARYRTEFRFIPTDSGTRVDQEFLCRPVSLLARCLAPLSFLMSGTIRQCLRNDFNDLKRCAEESRPSA
jgi:uncharacterized protein YndB with AHSA1/START domain